VYEDDSIYDKFFLDVSPCSNYLLTGSYNKSGHIVDINADNNVTVQAMFDANRGKALGKIRKYAINKKLSPLESGARQPDFKKKIVSGCWNPKENTVALAFRNCIFLSYDKNSSTSSK
jgi:hypothetical protein